MSAIPPPPAPAGPASSSISPARTNHRTPSLFAPSEQQLTRLMALLGEDHAVNELLTTALAYGLPIGQPKPSIQTRQIARDTRALARALTALHALIEADSPAWQALQQDAAEKAPDSPVAALVVALNTSALPDLIERANQLSAVTPVQRGRPADAEREQRMQLVREIARIAEACGLHIARLAPGFTELLEIVFDLTYITGISVDTAIRDLLDERSAQARQGIRRIRNLT